MNNIHLFRHPVSWLRCAHARGVPRAGALVLVLAAIGFATSACLVLSPDSEQRSAVHVSIRAVAHAGEAAGSGNAAKAPSCRTPAEYLTSPDQLSAVARIWRVADARNGDDQLLQEAPLAIGPLDDQQQVQLSGDVDLPVAAAGSTYRVEVALLVRGDRLVTDALAGDFSGRLDLASGLFVQVDRLLLRAASLPVTDGGIVLSSPTVNDGQPSAFTLSGIALNPQNGTLSARYENPELSFDGVPRHLVVDITGRLEPVAIYAGSTQLTVVPAGVRQDVELLLEPGNVPGDAGEVLTARLDFALVDGVPLHETGVLRVTRSTSLCGVLAP